MYTNIFQSFSAHLFDFIVPTTADRRTPPQTICDRMTLITAALTKIPHILSIVILYRTYITHTHKKSDAPMSRVSAHLPLVCMIFV